MLRTHFLDHQPIATAPPLRLGPAQPPAGFHERRVYRVLFAKDLRAEQVASLRTAWRTPADGTARPPRAVVSTAVATGSPGTCDGSATTLAWCLDVTVLLSTDATEAVGPTLSDLTNVLREHGLIPVTTERFS